MVGPPFAGRIGRFAIPYAMFGERPDVVHRILRETLVVRAELVFASQAIEYDGFCLGFEPIGEGTTIPDYDIEYDEDADQVTWVKRGL